MIPRIVIADDYPFAQHYGSLLLQHVIDVEITNVVHSQKDLLAVCRTTVPDVLVLGLTIAKSLSSEFQYLFSCDTTHIRLLIITEDRVVYKPYLTSTTPIVCYLKRRDIQQLFIPAVLMLSTGYVWHDQTNRSWYSQDMLEASYHHFPTTREIDVLHNMARGLTNAGIAYELGVTERTVRSYVEKLFERLKVDNRISAVMKALQIGWLDLADY
ncbi:MAG: response regulator transcription factor [Chloroflexota bacterium]